MQHYQQDASISDKGDLDMKHKFFASIIELQLHLETFNCTSNLVVTSSPEVRDI